LLPHLADDLAKMVSFDLNTGALDEVVCGLKWEWETHIPEPSFPLFFVFRRSDIMPPIQLCASSCANMLIRYSVDVLALWVTRRA
jgi:hypothetical protein